MKPVILAALATACCALGALPAQTVRHVPGQFATINAAIQAANPNDIVRVAPGRYHERVLIDRDLTLESSGGPWVTTIDGGGTGAVVRFSQSFLFGVVIDGFTVTNGTVGIAVGGPNGCTIRNNRILGNRSGYTGGGIDAYGTIAVITGNTITDNAAAWGGGIYTGDISGGQGDIIDNVIARNSATNDGGGIYAPYQPWGGVIRRNEIIGNTAGRDGGGAFVETWSHDFDNNVVVGNVAGRYGGGVYSDLGTRLTTLSHCTVANNRADVAGGGFMVANVAAIDNTILWGNTAPAGPEVALLSYGQVDLDYCILQGGALSVTTLLGSWLSSINVGPNVSTADPRFVDAAGGDYHLRADSPAIGAGIPRGFATDYEGDARSATPDLGADTFAPRTYVVGAARPGQPFTLRVVGTPASAVTIALSGTRGRRTPPLALPGITGVLVVPDPFVVVPAGVTGTHGVASIPFTLPASFPTPTPFVVQSLVGSTLTNAIDVWID